MFLRSTEVESLGRIKSKLSKCKFVSPGSFWPPLKSFIATILEDFGGMMKVSKSVKLELLIIVMDWFVFY